ncbi:Xenotropic and polytropic retrovirus receptor 1 [Diaporthe eres]|uniref:Xenotropic and polytropic retrovirus receptor 1 n=1 Tax=Diaporthe eres TaxID=83184 RepID=A0ABR1P2N4_DIAER
MKFAKELERDLVPEWRIKYLNYKAGKKHIKAVARAINRANGVSSTRLPARGPDQPHSGSASFRTAASANPVPAEDGADPLRTSPAPMGQSPPRSIPIKRPAPVAGERQGLMEGQESDMQYGSFVPTPPDHGPAPISESGQPSHLFELPAPAIKVPSNASNGQGQRPPETPRVNSASSVHRLALNRTVSRAGSQSGAAAARAPAPGRFPSAAGATFPNLTPSDMQSPRARLRRMFSLAGPSLERYRSRGEYDMHAFDEVREKEKEFFEFLDSELQKVENFYRQKEDHAGKRLAMLREQLHEMRNRRISEIAEAKRRKRDGESNGHDAKEGFKSNGAGPLPMLDPIKAKLFRPGPNTKALQKMPQTPVHNGTNPEERRDYVRRPDEHEVPYRTAKRKLKLALQEFYRGLELLKSYALLNRTAFRKLNKKFDKSTHARPPYRYMNEKVNKSWFVNSDVLDGHLQAVEDLYARYFERGNHKLAAGKLRNLMKKKRDESGSAFRNGLLIGVGAVFAVQGLVQGAQLLFDEDEDVRSQTSYLMQIYGGYFLMLFLFSMFCLNCKIWTANRVNYPFIFEFDPRNQLDWRQLSEFPSFFLFLFGLFMWLNFTRYGSAAMYLYYPVLLIFITALILFMPAPIFWHKGRRWFLYSHWRLFFAGLYPVEFRDFFLGDMYCSLTYAMCNIELFFCLYAHSWDEPQQCNSNHSRLLGFFAFGDFFINGGKYTASILSGVFLSIYRINNTSRNLGLFIAFSIVNGFYTAFWDIFMDFSLVQPHARHRFLRDITALKSRWPYYLIMILDPILRFNWVFYAIFTHDTQHSSIASFLIGFAEVTRRGMWTLLRVENEHCSNVAQYKASRDVPLPYHLDTGITALTSARVSSDSNAGKQPQDDDPSAFTPALRTATWTGAIENRPPSGAVSTGVDVPGTASGARPGLSSAATADVIEEGRTPGEDSLRMRRRADTVGKRSIVRILADAHKQDFEKKRKPASTKGGGSGAAVLDGTVDVDEDDDDDDDDDDLGAVDDGTDDDETGSMLDERMEVREAEVMLGKGRDGSEL